MNYNTLAFAPTAAAKRLVKGHAANSRTYLWIVAIVALTGIETVLNWLAKHYDSRDIYLLQGQLKQALAKRWFVRQLIKAEKFRIDNAPHVVSALGKVFCLD